MRFTLGLALLGLVLMVSAVGAEPAWEVYLSKTQDVLGVRLEVLRNSLERLSEAHTVKMQERIAELETHYYQGRKLIQEAEGAGEPDETTQGAITRRMRGYSEALRNFDRCMEIIRWMPYGVNLEDFHGEVKRLSRLCRSRMSALEVELRSHQEDLAESVASERQAREVERSARLECRQPERIPQPPLCIARDHIGQ